MNFTSSSVSLRKAGEGQRKSNGGGDGLQKLEKEDVETNVLTTKKSKIVSKREGKQNFFRAEELQYDSGPCLYTII